jgi:hypothetical protein
MHVLLISRPMRNLIGIPWFSISTLLKTLLPLDVKLDDGLVWLRNTDPV